MWEKLGLSLFRLFPMKDWSGWLTPVWDLTSSCSESTSRRISPLFYFSIIPGPDAFLFPSAANNKQVVATLQLATFSSRCPHLVPERTPEGHTHVAFISVFMCLWAFVLYFLCVCVCVRLWVCAYHSPRHPQTKKTSYSLGAETCILSRVLKKEPFSLCVCVCVFVCVREREIERGNEEERDEREQKNLANVIPLQQYKREQSQCSVHTMGLPAAYSYGWVVSVMQIDHGTARANLSAAGLS